MFTLASTGLVLSVASPASALTGCGVEPNDNNVYLDCVLPPSTTPYTAFTDGQQINISMGPNGTFSPNDALGGEVVAVECSYNGSNPTDFTNQCAAQTTDGNWPIAVNANGSFDFFAQTGVKQPVYALPDATFPAATIHCDATHPCVWWIGEDPTGGFTSAPHVFSRPFTVGPTTATPESPVTLALPIAAGAVIAGAVYVVVRRRGSRALT
jgi:hypothetical protein